MNKVLPLGTLVCTVSLLASPAAAQDQDYGQADQPQRAESSPHHETIETLVGADVHLSSSGKDEASGKVQDVVAAGDGSIRWAIVATDGRECLVPFQKLRWNAEKERFDLPMAVSALKEKPEFDLEKAREKGLAQAVAAAEGHWDVSSRARVQEASARKRTGTFEKTSFRRAPDAMLVGSEIDELEVYGQAEQFGGVATTIVNCTSGRIEYLVVSRGGLVGIGNTEYLVPFEALTACRREAEEGEKPEDAQLLLCSDKSVEDLESAPEYEEPSEDDALVSDTNCAEAKRFFGLEDEKKKRTKGDGKR